ncbi:MAG: alpha/beta fold hydrolase [Alphaproteobacteria bacterium]|nr:alpha/beta fold hydrolase [Alphaproteobacteria bacterium]MCB9928633.1 alpha/beta fold hydrolase [Alphaproteobacteria bacterium]
MPWIEANGVTLHYSLDGPETGRPLVLVHELGGTSHSWQPLIPRVTAAGHKVLRWDWRGSGLSEKIRGDFSIDDMCADLAALMEAVGFGQPADMVGTALGGGVAIAFAARYPARVRKLVVSSPATGSPGGNERIMTRAAGVKKDGMRPFADPSLALSYPEKYRTDPAAFAEYRNRWICNDPDSFAAHNLMLGAMDESVNFGKLACKALVLSGSDDPLRTPAAVKEIADAIPGADYRELQAGHFLPVYAPDLWAETVLPWLAA